MEAYCRERLGRADFRRMCQYAEVPPRIHGCDKKGLALLGESRRYFAHLTGARQFDTETIQEELLDTTRRAAALMQACLLRELGFGRRQREHLLVQHYSNWPLPMVTQSHSARSKRHKWLST